MIGLGVDHDDLVQKVKGNGKAGKPQSREPAKYYGGKAVYSPLCLYMCTSMCSDEECVHKNAELLKSPFRLPHVEPLCCFFISLFVYITNSCGLVGVVVTKHTRHQNWEVLVRTGFESHVMSQNVLPESRPCSTI